VCYGSMSVRVRNDRVHISGPCPLSPPISTVERTSRYVGFVPGADHVWSPMYATQCRKKLRCLVSSSSYHGAADIEVGR